MNENTSQDVKGEIGSKWQGDSPENRPESLVTELATSKKSQKSNIEVEDRSKSSKSNRQKIQLKRGLNIDDKIRNINVTNSELANKDTEPLNTDRYTTEKGEIVDSHIE